MIQIQSSQEAIFHIVGTFDNQNIFAAYMCISFVAMYFFIHKDDRDALKPYTVYGNDSIVTVASGESALLQLGLINSHVSHLDKRRSHFYPTLFVESFDTLKYEQTSLCVYYLLDIVWE